MQVCHEKFTPYAGGGYAGALRSRSAGGRDSFRGGWESGESTQVLLLDVISDIWREIDFNDRIKKGLDKHRLFGVQYNMYIKMISFYVL